MPAPLTKPAGGNLYSSTTVRNGDGYLAIFTLPIRSAACRPISAATTVCPGEHGEYYGDDCFCLYLGLVQAHELATIVFHNVRKPELNKIAMGFLFHRLIIVGRGVTDLDKQTAEVQTILAETISRQLD